MVSSSSGIFISSAAQHRLATSNRSSSVRGCGTVMPTLSFDAMRQPSLGCASRT
jgi:hypothetical protein